MENDDLIISRTCSISLNVMIACLFIVGKVSGTTILQSKDVKNDTYCFYVWQVIIIVRAEQGECLYSRNLLPCTVRTSRQRLCNQRVGWVEKWLVVHHPIVVYYQKILRFVSEKGIFLREGGDIELYTTQVPKVL